MKCSQKVPRRLILLIVLLAGCNYPTNSSPDAQGIVTAVVGTLTAEASRVPTETELPPLLPHSLYFLSDRSGLSQVWQLSPDGTTITQVTNEASEVEDFSVSNTGSLAYVSENKLVFLSAGGERTVLIDRSDADPDAPDYYYNQLVKSPRLSFDGEVLAYSLDGIYFYSTLSGETNQILPNQLLTAEDGSVSAFELYYPLSWSPDGSRLLINIAFGEGSLLAILNREDVSLVELQALGTFCCQAIWVPDSRFVLVASPYTGLVESGLWRYDASTGGESLLIHGYSDSVYNFAGWPMQLSNGNLQYFFTSSPELPQGDQSFYLVKSDRDGITGREQLRPEAFNIVDALWSEDGSFVLLVQPGLAGSGNSGSVVLVFTDGRPVIGLLDQARSLGWGP